MPYITAFTLKIQGASTMCPPCTESRTIFFPKNLFLRLQFRHPQDLVADKPFHNAVYYGVSYCFALVLR